MTDFNETDEQKSALRRNAEQLLSDNFARLYQRFDILNEKLDSFSERFNRLAVDIGRLENELKHVHKDLAEQRKINEINTKELQHWKTTRVILAWVAGVLGTLAGAGLIALTSEDLK